MIKPETASNRWAKKVVSKSEERFRRDALERLEGYYAWDTKVRDFIVAELEAVVAASKEYPRRQYEYSVRRKQQWAPPLRQVILFSRRKMLVPTHHSQYQKLRSNQQLRPIERELEQEAAAKLVFTHADDGSLIVLAYPHHSSQGKLVDEKPQVLFYAANAASIVTYRGRHRVRKAIERFLFLDNFSAFGKKPRPRDTSTLKKISKNDQRMAPLWKDPIEQRREHHKLDVAFGIALLAGVAGPFFLESIKVIRNADTWSVELLWLSALVAVVGWRVKKEIERR